jgi:16S rRNA (guanine527-N7)-methyltransferase
MDLPSANRMAALLQPYLEGPAPSEVLSALRGYLELLLRWNARTNLTAIRDPEELVQRQIGESLLAGRYLGNSGTLLDFGSGAGFPGIPLQILRPGLRVTLAESQGKKASFLRESVRTLSLGCEVWAKRAEQLPSTRTFGAVTMRAVDATDAMLPYAAARVSPAGLLVRYTAGGTPAELAGWTVSTDVPLPNSEGRLVCLTRV